MALIPVCWVQLGMWVNVTIKQLLGHTHRHSHKAHTKFLNLSTKNANYSQACFQPLTQSLYVVLEEKQCLGWGSGPVSKVFASQARGLEFNLKNPYEKSGMLEIL